jgi:hypothetical protein
MTDSEKPTDESRLEFLLGKTKELCKELSLRESIIQDTYNEATDWAFIIKIDSLHEIACRDLLRKSLTFSRPDVARKQDVIDSFIDGLPINGRASLLKLLTASGCPADLATHIEVVRKIRNGYAHDIRHLDRPLLEHVLSRDDKTYIFKTLWPIDAPYTEAAFLDLAQKGDRMLRYIIFDHTLRFLTMAYLIFYTKPHS